MRIIKHAKRLMAALLATTSLGAVAATAPIAVRGEMLDCNGGKSYNYRFVIKNVSGNVLKADWQLYFTQFPRKVTITNEPGMQVEEIKPGYYCFSPTEAYKPLAAGDSLAIDVSMRGPFYSHNFQPEGAHVVMGGDMKHPIPLQLTYSELKDPKQWVERVDYRDGRAAYEANAAVNTGTVSYTPDALDIFPTPKKVTRLKGVTAILPKMQVISTDNASRVKESMKLLLRSMGVQIVDESRSQLNIVVRPIKVDGKDVDDEYYRLKINKGRMTIEAKTEEGALRGASTLVGIIGRNGNVYKALPNVDIEDWPDFKYRGFMLDISRNFTGYNDVIRFLGILAFYKFNVLQFHLTDDEGWRLEIPGLPELTEVGSRRGCTRTETDFLAQSYTGNGNPNDTSTTANGYITRDEFIQLLKIANVCGIKVIPEIETPGHARAAIVAMRARYNKYKDTDPEKAAQYMLWDDANTSTFTSAQGYHDNVLNPAQDGVYNFVQKVVEEIKLMYAEAGLKLDVIHLGGDEVPASSWDNSPAVHKLMQDNGFKTSHEVSEYYMRRITDWLYPQGIKVEGWQEVAMKHPDAYNEVMAPRFAGVNAWSTLGSRDSIPYYLANAGYPVILSNVNNFYMDLAYCTHQYEDGLRWGGVVDEFASFSALPWDIYRTARTDWEGKPRDLKYADYGKPALKKPENIIGVQVQLWAETIRSFEQVQRYIFPKMFGMVERAWNSHPSWEGKYDDDTEYRAAREQYNLKIGLNELPLLNRVGFDFHLAQPGIIVEDGMLLANAQYPGVQIRYTLDGSDPTEASPLWTEPVPVPEVPLIKARAFYLDRKSVASYLWLDKK